MTHEAAKQIARRAFESTCAPTIEQVAEVIQSALDAQAGEPSGDHTKAIDEAFLELGDPSMYKSILRKLVAKVTKPEGQSPTVATLPYSALWEIAEFFNLDYNDLIQVTDDYEKRLLAQGGGQPCNQVEENSTLPKSDPSAVAIHANLISRGESVLRGETPGAVPHNDAEIMRGVIAAQMANCADMVSDPNGPYPACKNTLETYTCDVREMDGACPAIPREHRWRFKETTPSAEDGPTPETDANLAFCRLVRDLEGSAQTDAIIARQFARSLERCLLASQRLSEHLRCSFEELRKGWSEIVARQETELTESRELCDRLTKERDGLIPLAYETRPGMAIGPVTWQDCYKQALKSYYDAQDERDTARDDCKRLQAQCDRVNAENRELRTVIGKLKSCAHFCSDGNCPHDRKYRSLTTALTQIDKELAP